MRENTTDSKENRQKKRKQTKHILLLLSKGRTKVLLYTTYALGNICFLCLLFVFKILCFEMLLTVLTLNKVVTNEFFQWENALFGGDI